LKEPADIAKLVRMSAPIFDFSHLSPAERIELAEQLWDSIEPGGVTLTPSQVAELRQRRAALATDGDPGDPWARTLDEIEERGA
jgi:putative addiction module component (TIGR02574 family)